MEAVSVKKISSKNEEYENRKMLSCRFVFVDSTGGNGSK